MAKKKTKRPPRPYIASTTIYGLDRMTKAQRKAIARWMHSRAEWVLKHGDLAAGRFIQRLMT